MMTPEAHEALCSLELEPKAPAREVREGFPEEVTWYMRSHRR